MPAVLAGNAALAGFHGLRQGATVYVRVRPEAESDLVVSFEPVKGWESCAEYFYVQEPDGNILSRRKIAAGRKAGKEIIALDAGSGDYRIMFSGWTYHSYSIATQPRLPMVAGTAPVHRSFSGAPETLFFRVPGGTSEFTFCVKNHNRTPMVVSLVSPAPEENCRIDATSSLKGVKDRSNLRNERSYFHNWEYDRKTFRAPSPGIWKVRLHGTSKAGIWLEGIPNYFASRSSDLFIPKVAPGQCLIAADARSITGPVGSLGASFPDPRVTVLMDERIRSLKLESVCKYVNQEYRERNNDDSDPGNLNPRGFNWSAEDRRLKAVRDWGAETLLIAQPAQWLGGRRGIFEKGDIALKEYGEFIVHLLEHYNADLNEPIRYLSIIDEPDFHYEVEEYARAIKVISGRIKSHPDPRVRSTRIMAPQSSMFLNNPRGTARSGVRFAEYLYKECDALVDGIAWDQWRHRNMLDTWRYGKAIQRAAEIQERFDSDGNREEAICIFQTNLYGGGAVSLQDTRTFYASLWWASVVANCMKTGRMSSLNWFPTFDDPHHMKGLCYAPEEGGGFKPVGYVMKMLNGALLDNAVESSSTHPEIDELVTLSADGRSLSILAVNKMRRTIKLSLRVKLPRLLCNRECTHTLKTMRKGDKELMVRQEENMSTTGIFLFESELAGRSIQVLELCPVESSGSS